VFSLPISPGAHLIPANTAPIVATINVKERV